MNKIKVSGIFIFLMTMLSIAVSSWAEIYKWVDENGKVHFGDKPPAGKQADEVNVTNINVINRDSGNKAAAKTSDAPRKYIKLPDGSDYPLPRNSEEAAKLEAAVQQAAEKIKRQSNAAHFLAAPTRLTVREAASSGASRNLPCPITNKTDCSNRQDLKGADYSKLNFSHVNFSHSDLEGADFNGARIGTGTSFAGANMRNVNFNGADLNNIDFTGADLSGADFTHIQCERCIFDEANLTKAVFSGELLGRISFVGANLNGVIFQKPMQHWAGWDLRDVKQFDLDKFAELALARENKNRILWMRYSYNDCQIGIDGADCSKKDLSGHRFLPVNLENVNFSGANMKGADLSHVTSFKNNDFTGAILEGAVMPVMNQDGKNNFRQANLNGVRFTGNRIYGDFTGASLQGVVFTGIDLAGAKLKGAKLVGAILKGAQIYASQLAEADTAGCERCEELVKQSRVDPVALKKYLSSTTPAGITPKDKTAVSGELKSRFQMMMQLGLLTNGQGIINEDDLVDLLKQILAPDKDTYYSTAFRIIQRQQEKAWRQGRVSNLCFRHELQDSLIPLLSYQGVESDNGTKTRASRNKLDPEDVRGNAAECLLYAVNQSPAIQKAFIDAFRREDDKATKRILIHGLVEANTKETLPLLVETLREGDLRSSESAALQLATWNRLPMELLPWLIEKYQGNRNIPEGYSRLLASYGASAREYLPELIAYNTEKKKNKWKDDGLSLLIESLQSSTNLQVFDRLPMNYGERAVLDSFLIPEESLAEYRLKLAPSPSHFLTVAPGNGGDSYYSIIKQRLFEWYYQAKYYFEGQPKLENPVYTDDNYFIDRLASCHKISGTYEDNISAVAGVEYQTDVDVPPGYENRIGIDTFVFNTDSEAEKTGTFLLSNLGTHSTVMRRGRIIYILWGDMITVDYLGGLYNVINNKKMEQ